MLTNIWNFLEGKKTYLISLAGIIYGLHVGDSQIVITSLIGMGLRRGLATTAAQLVK